MAAAWYAAELWREIRPIVGAHKWLAGTNVRIVGRQFQSPEITLFQIHTRLVVHLGATHRDEAAMELIDGDLLLLLEGQAEEFHRNLEHGIDQGSRNAVVADIEKSRTLRCLP